MKKAKHQDGGTVDTEDLKSSGLTAHAGSSPAPGNNTIVSKQLDKIIQEPTITISSKEYLELIIIRNKLKDFYIVADKLADVAKTVIQSSIIKFEKSLASLQIALNEYINLRNKDKENPWKFIKRN